MEEMWNNFTKPKEIDQKFADYVQGILIENSNLREMLKIQNSQVVTNDTLTQLENEIQEFISDDSIEEEKLDTSLMMKRAITTTQDRKATQKQKSPLNSSKSPSKTSTRKDTEIKNRRPESKYLFDSPENSEEEDDSPPKEDKPEIKNVQSKYLF